MLSVGAIIFLVIVAQQVLVFFIIFVLHTSKPSQMESVRQLSGTCRIAAASDSVLNSECVYTFHTPLRGGLFVSCVDFIGVHRPTVPGLYVKITQTSKRKNLEQSNNADAIKLAINVEGGFDTERYEIISEYAVTVVDDQSQITVELPFNDETKDTFPPRVVQSVESILHHTTLTTQQEVTQWELETHPLPVSKYAPDLPFVDNGVTISPHVSDWKCQKDGSATNLWLNLSDGFIGGGRKMWEGSGGSNGALDHYEETGRKYPLVVKLGTISQETADCYSYAPDEDGPVKVPNLAALLAKRGIQMGALQKTVKSTAELEVELNATYAFDAITEEGAHLQPVALPGLQNLGNSCYLNSVVQMLFSIPEMSQRYGQKAHEHMCQGVSPKNALSNVLVQTTRLASALTDTTFVKPLEADAEDPQYRLAPRLFKHCIGKDHADFSTGQQQDAAQFLQYYLERLDRAELASSTTAHRQLQPTSSHLFSFAVQQRRVCVADQTVRYSTATAPDTILSLRIPMKQAVVKENHEVSTFDTPKSPDTKRMKKDDEPVPSISMASIVQAWAEENTVADLRWAHLQNAVHPAQETVRMENFPRYLLIQLQRYTLGSDWQPIKLKVKVEHADSILDLTLYRAKGQQPGETLVPEEPDEARTGASSVRIDEGALSQLMNMGFSMNSCKRALHAVGGSDVEAAMEWVFEHNTDPDFHDPLPEDIPDTSGEIAVDETVVESLVSSLGCFTTDQVRAALKECGGTADRAADWLFSHMDDLDNAIQGSSTSSARSGEASKILLGDGEGKYKLTGMISHIGKHTGSGHYVAHLLRDDKWILFNDEKVAESASAPFPHAYLYLYQRLDTIGKPHSEY